MGQERPRYLSYLLRMWRIDDDGAAWYASLESSMSRERRGFASLESLFDFLRMQAKPDAERDFECRSEHHKGRTI